jgi:D-alanyl-D-alanine dipeptidase
VPTDGWRDVPIEPVDEPLVRVADISPRVHDDPRYHAAGLAGAMPHGWLREGVAEALARAAAGLPDGLSLVVWDGYRPIATQAALFDAYLVELAMVHPDWPADALEDAAARYVTPPSRSRAAPPPHLTGGAVDLTLADGDGRPLDLGTDFDAFVPEAGARALEGVEGVARDNRRLLYWAMREQGFTAYVEEWWHFDRGDQFWGLATGSPARYEGADAPE